MKSLLFVFFLSMTLFKAEGQIDGDFEYGDYSGVDMQMKIYPKDSSANAVVLKEFGKAWIDLDRDYKFKVFYYVHKRVKILGKAALDQGNIEIRLHKSNTDTREKIRDIKATTYYLESNKIRSASLLESNIFTEKSPSYDIVKFAIPNVTEGAIIEYSYFTESPFLWNFQTWFFQEDIPKIKSEFWAKIPATHTYNISLRGFYKLSKMDGDIVNDCLSFGSGSAQCSLNKYVMENVPAFKEEDYMTSKYNFLSAIYFEWKEYKGIDNGVTTKITKEWKDADNELRQMESFGGQIKRGRYNFWEERLSSTIGNETDTLKKAKKVYDFIKKWYTWNEGKGILCDNGIKKAYEKRSGDVSEVNLSLISALRYANINTQPVILSTRDQALPIELFPVLSGFNYVIATCKINGKNYFLDATDPYLPFGMLPMRCLNGKGRVINTDFRSDWVEIPNKTRRKTTTLIDLKLDNSGTFKGTMTRNYYGYDAFIKRKEILSFNTTSEYIKNKNEREGMSILNFKVDHLDNPDSILIEHFEMELKSFDNLNGERFHFDPFIIHFRKDNPFKSIERLFPVDFGMPTDFQATIQLEFPSNLRLANSPEKIGLALPQNGGKYLLNSQVFENKVIINQLLSLNRAIYSSDEYHYLKELFNRVVQSQNIDLIFEKKE